MFAAVFRAGPGSSGRLPDAFSGTGDHLRTVTSMLARERRLRRDRRVLLAMDERWLEDIGVSRGEILRPGRAGG